MKNWINKNRKILIICLIILVIILLVIIGIFIFGNPKKKEVNIYNYTNKSEELPGSKEYTSNKLKASHCLKKICVENVVFHYTDNAGRVDLTVYNKTNKKKSGYLKMVFKEQELVIIYDVDGGGRIQTSSNYEGFEIKDKENYTLEELSKEEIEEITKK